MLNPERILEQANEIYRKTKAEKCGLDPEFVTLNRFPPMPSDQIKALCEALCKAINEELFKVL